MFFFLRYMMSGMRDFFSGLLSTLYRLLVYPGRGIRAGIVGTALAFAAGILSGEESRPLPADAREELAAFARRALSGEVQSVTPAMLMKSHEALRQVNPEHLQLTIFRDRAPSIRLASPRNGIVEATLAAMLKARTLPSFEFYSYGDARNVAMLFERVLERHTVPSNRWFAELPFLNLGVHGVAITHEGTPGLEATRSGLLPPSEVFTKGLEDRDAFIGRLSSSLKLYPKPPRVQPRDSLIWDKLKTKVELVSFETFVSRGPAYRTVELYRMNDLNVPPWKDVMPVAVWMGEFLVKHQTRDGRFFHLYDARRGTWDYAYYDIVDHCYAVITLLDLSAATGDKRFLDAATRAIGFLKKQFRVEKPPKGGTPSSGSGTPPFVYVVFDEKAKLGAAGLAVVALDRYASLTGGVFQDEDMRLLGRFILHQQYDDGSFSHYYRYDRNVPYEDRVTNSFPGQALWGLAVLERRTGDETWRKAARKAAERLITRREQEMHWSEPPADGWLAAALHVLDTPFAETSHLDYARRMADVVVKQQKVTNVGPDMVGSFEGDPEGSVEGTAIRTRLLGEVLSFTVNPAEKSDAYLRAMRRAVAFIRLNELRPNNAFYLSDPEQVYGMVRASSFENDVRLSTTCQVIQALLWLDRVEKMRATR